jgi:hypothetical protein
MKNVFIILVFSIIAATIILMVFNLFPENQENPVEILKKELIKASAVEGELIEYKNLFLEKDFYLNHNSLIESENMLVSFECNDPSSCCLEGEKCEKIQWTKTTLFNKNNKRINFYTRCTNIENLTGCMIYFGKSPGEVKITQLKKEDQVILVNFKNKGLEILRETSGEMEVMTLLNESWEKIDQTYQKQYIDFLESNQESFFGWAIKINTPGKYKAIIKISSKNAGIDINEIEFDIETNENCEIIPETRIINWGEDNYREIHECEGCDFGYECLEKWANKKPKSELKILTNNSVYCEGDKKVLSEGC